MSTKTVVPVTKNEELELEITGFTHEGNGVGKVSGYTLSVPEALPGERIKAQVVKTGRQYGFAKILEIIKPSEHREKPACPIYNQCGGCSLQHMSYKQQLQQKTILVEDNLRRIGKIEHAVIHPTLGMKDPWRYRNKAQVPIGEEEGGLIGGFYAA